MKNRTTTARNQFLKLALSGIIAAGSLTSAQAQNATTSPTPQIKYIGTMGEKLVFQVAYDNQSQDGFSVEIKDEQGYQFYFDKFRDKTFKKRYVIDKDELGNNTISFTVATKATVEQQTFNVNASFRVVEEVRVVKL